MSLPKDAAAAAIVTPAAPPTGRLARLIQFQAVRIAEQTQALDDVQAMRAAYAAHEGIQERLLTRSDRLAPQLGIEQALAGGRERLAVVALLAAFLVAVLSYSLVLSVVGHDRRINAMAALVAVLGPHFLSLLLWFLALLFGGSGGGLAKGLLNLSTRLPGLGGQASRLLLQATLEVMGRSRGLSAWLFGLMTHLVWSLAFVFTLLGLLMAFSFLSYQLSWETTILDGEAFARFAHMTGRLPALFGFATPAVDHMLDGHGDHRAWAIWLMGCTLVYGLGLRLVLVILSGLRARSLLAGLALADGSDPYVRRLMARFDAMQAAQVLDAESPAAGRSVNTHLATDHQAGLAVIGFELPDSQGWPAIAAWQHGLLLARTDGALAGKRQLLEHLQQLAPAHLLLVCNAGASPDRATERFLRAAAACAGHSALLLESVPGHQESAQRWRDWLAEIRIEPPLEAVFDAAVDAAAWASTGVSQHG
ncbi:DUF2868 domain-containing protein [Roseateles oligotrophus]|uniref:DUF2868 domain-containing protein n=1 Tax=Roseateles oligotrophus TaxID=1769250 RepID=A0ABT2YM48_9BURK|nr:DUF2868 domain-containing protein [Roseateles oligotrophus]MCV2371139.1 DUF2868 domain-containing protein [Roseateles oligotrophus]